MVDRSVSSDMSAPFEAADVAAPHQAAAPGTRKTLKHRKPRGSRAGASVQRKRDAEKAAQRASVFTMPVEGETQYRVASNQKLEAALQQLNAICAAEIEMAPYDSTPRAEPAEISRLGAGRNRITTDWSNVPVLEAAVAQYDVWCERVPSLHKRFDILEWMVYVDTVVQARLANLGTVELANFANTRDAVGGSTMLAANAVLPASVTAALECLRPVRQQTGGTLWFAPYAYQAREKAAAAAASAAAAAAQAGDDEGARKVDLAMFDDKGAPIYHTSVKNIVLKAPTTYDDGQAADKTQQTPFEAIRVDVARLAELRESLSATVVTPQQVAEAVGYPLLTRAYHIAKDRIPLPSARFRVHDGTVFSEVMRIAYALLSMNKQLGTPLVKGFDPRTWMSTVTMPYAQLHKNGDLQVSPSHPFKMIFTPLLTRKSAAKNKDRMASVGLDPVLYPGRIWAERREVMLRYGHALKTDSREFCEWVSAHQRTNFPP